MKDFFNLPEKLKKLDEIALQKTKEQFEYISKEVQNGTFIKLQY